jgi:hypothetical protein
MYCHTFFCSYKFHIIENYLIFEMLKKNIWAISQRIIELFTQKIVTKLSKIWVWDPGPEIWDPIPDPGSRGQKSTGSGSATLGATVACNSYACSDQHRKTFRQYRKKTSKIKNYIISCTIFKFLVSVAFLHFKVKI